MMVVLRLVTVFREVVVLRIIGVLRLPLDLVVGQTVETAWEAPPF